MSAALAQSLVSAGFDVVVEARDRLAVIIPSGMGTSVRLTTADRERIVGLARSHGFSHVAIEIPEDAELHRGKP